MAEDVEFGRLTPEMVANAPKDSARFNALATIWRKYPDKTNAWFHVHDVVRLAYQRAMDGDNLLLYGRVASPNYHRYVERYIGELYLYMPGLVFFRSIDEKGVHGGMMQVGIRRGKSLSLRVLLFGEHNDVVGTYLEILGSSGEGGLRNYGFQRQVGCSAYIRLNGDREIPDEYLGIDSARWALMYPTLQEWFPGLIIE